MTIENNNGSAAGTDYRPAHVKPVDDLTSTNIIESELSKSTASDTKTDDTTSSGTTDAVEKSGGVPAQILTETILGPSKVQWNDKRGSAEPDELDFSVDAADNPFASKFNALTADKSVLDDPFSSKFNDLKPGDKTKVAPEKGDSEQPAGETKPAEQTTTSEQTKPVEETKPAQQTKPEAANPFKFNDLAKSVGNLFSGDQEAARIVKNATLGKAKLDAQDGHYLKQLSGVADIKAVAEPGEGDNPKDYTHKNADGSSYNVVDGKIKSFTTAPTKDNPNGLTYKDFTYDDKGRVTSYVTPTGNTNSRITEPDSKGIAQWKTTSADGKTASPWVGNATVDADGLRSTVGGAAGTMYSRNMDGSYSVTRALHNGREMTGLSSTTTLPDNTVVSRNESFDKTTRAFKPDNANVTVKEADGLKVSQVSFDKSEKGEIVQEPKPDVTAGGDSAIAMFGNLLKSGPDMLKNVESLDIHRTGDKRFHINGDLNNVYMPPPNITVGGFGPLGRVSATPMGGTVDKFSLDLSFNDRTVNADNIRGLNGSASLSRTGLFGRTKNIGSRATSTTGMVWDTQADTMLAKSPERNTLLNGSNFAPDSMNGKLLNDEAAEAKAKDMLSSLDKNLNSAKIRQIQPGVFEGSLDLKANRMTVAKLPGVESTLYMDDKVDFKMSANGIEFKPGEVQLGIQYGNNEETRREVSKISTETTAKGESSIKVQFHDGTNLSFPVPKPAVAQTGDGKPVPPKSPVGQNASRDAMPASNPPAERSATTGERPVVATERTSAPTQTMHRNNIRNCEPEPRRRFFRRGR